MFLIKILISALLIAAASELAKRSTLAASILVSLPLTSILALSFLYYETRDPARTGELSLGIFWAVLPSLLFFLVLPLLLRAGFRFVPALALACAAMAAAYAGYAALLGRLGVRLG
jgi:hypothetical protein